MELTADLQGTTINKLRKQWLSFTIVSLVFLASGFLVLYYWWDPASASRWLLLVAIGAVYMIVTLWRGLPYNHPPGDTILLDTLGAANWATLLRGLLLAGLAGFLFSPRPLGWLAWVPGLLYTIAALVDILDGYLARVTNHATLLGEHLDMSLDGAGVLIASALAVQYGQVPFWYLLVGLSRYLFLAGIWIRERLHRQIHPLPPSAHRRAIAGLQMGFLAVILLPLFSPPGTYLAAALIALPFLVSFLKDWLYVSGILKPDRSDSSKVIQFAAQWLPLLLRFAAVLLVFVTIIYNARAHPDSNFLETIIILEIITALLILTGVAGRAAAIAGLVLLGFNQMAAALSLPQYALVIIYIAIIYLGTGPLSLWTPENRLIRQRAGRAGDQPEGFRAP